MGGLETRVEPTRRLSRDGAGKEHMVLADLRYVEDDGAQHNTPPLLPWPNIASRRYKVWAPTRSSTSSVSRSPPFPTPASSKLLIGNVSSGLDTTS